MKLLDVQNHFDADSQKYELKYTFQTPDGGQYVIQTGGIDTDEAREVAEALAFRCWKEDRAYDLRHSHPRKNPKGRRRPSPKPGKEQ